jgi:protein-tyrosine phosphatase
VTELYWVDGPWSGKLAVAARPRGGDWLKDEIAAWHRARINSVVSLLTPDEEQSLDLNDEARIAKAAGFDFISFPIPDRQVPASQAAMAGVLEKINAALASGKNAVIHCRQGIGRSGLVAACLLITRGSDPVVAVETLSRKRGVPIPETPEQRRWIDNFAASLAGAKS